MQEGIPGRKHCPLPSQADLGFLDSPWPAFEFSARKREGAREFPHRNGRTRADTLLLVNHTHTHPYTISTKEMYCTSTVTGAGRMIQMSFGPLLFLG